jgi:hypothetical protein
VGTATATTSLDDVTSYKLIVSVLPEAPGVKNLRAMASTSMAPGEKLLDVV